MRPMIITTENPPGYPGGGNLPSRGPQVVAYRVRYCPVDMEGAWKYHRQEANGLIVTPEVEAGVEYIVEIQCIPDVGQPSDWVRLQHTVVGQDAPLSPPTALNVTAGADHNKLHVTLPPALAADVQVRFEWAADAGGSPGTWSFLDLAKGTETKDTYTDGATRWYRARLEDYQGNFSTWTAAVSSKAKTVADGADVTALDPRVQAFTYGENRAPNPSFEQNLSGLPSPNSVSTVGEKLIDGWEIKRVDDSNLSFRWSTGDPVTGAYNLDFLFNTGSLPAGSRYVSEITPIEKIRVEAGDTMYAAAVCKWVKNVSLPSGWTSDLRLYVYWYSGDSFISSGSISDTSEPTTYKTLFDFFTVPSNATHAEIRPYAAWDGTGSANDFVQFSSYYNARFDYVEFRKATSDDAGSEVQVGDHRNLPFFIHAGGLTGVDVTLDTGTDGVDAHIDIDPGWSLVGGGVTLSGGPSGQVGGLAHVTTYYVYADIAAPNTLSGATFGVTTNVYTARNAKNRVYLGQATTPDTGGSGGGTVNCVTVDMLMADGRRAGDLRVGDAALLHTVDGAPYSGVVRRADHYTRPVYRVRWSDDWLDCTDAAPLWDGSGWVTPGECTSLLVYRQGKLAKETVRVEYLGEREIVHLYFDDNAFLSSATGRSFALHHNAKDLEF